MEKLSEKDLKKIIESLQKRVSPIIIYLFGSYVRGEANKESDIDIAFLSQQEFSSYDVYLYAQELADLLNKEIDLVDLNKASTVFQTKIISTGKIIFCSDVKKKMLFEMNVFKIYARLNEERKNILEKIQERGTVYG